MTQFVVRVDITELTDEQLLVWDSRKLGQGIHTLSEHGPQQPIDCEQEGWVIEASSPEMAWKVAEAEISTIAIAGHPGLAAMLTIRSVAEITQVELEQLREIDRDNRG
jgi:hypothetical protein